MTRVANLTLHKLQARTGHYRVRTFDGLVTGTAAVSPVSVAVSFRAGARAVRARAALAALVLTLFSAAMVGEAKALALKSGATGEDGHPLVTPYVSVFKPSAGDDHRFALDYSCRLGEELAAQIGMQREKLGDGDVIGFGFEGSRHGGLPPRPFSSGDEGFAAPSERQPGPTTQLTAATRLWHRMVSRLLWAGDHEVTCPGR
jgi:hypothetical protein